VRHFAKNSHRWKWFQAQTIVKGHGWKWFQARPIVEGHGWKWFHPWWGWQLTNRNWVNVSERLAGGCVSKRNQIDWSHVGNGRGWGNPDGLLVQVPCG
jgi:hypothetical protein